MLENYNIFRCNIKCKISSDVNPFMTYSCNGKFIAQCKFFDVQKPCYVRLAQLPSNATTLAPACGQ